jgi:signal transduction histidine kinase
MPTVATHLSEGRDPAERCRHAARRTCGAPIVGQVILRKEDATRPSRRYRRRMTRRNWALDGTVAAVVVALGQLEAWNGAGATHRQGPHWAEALLFLVVGTVLVFRRVSPLGVLAVMGVAYIVEFAIFGSPEGNGILTPIAVIAYTTGRWERGRRALAGLAGGVAIGVAWLTLDPMDTTLLAKGEALLWVTPFVIAWLVGALVRSQAQNLEQRRLQQDERASRAVAEERNRIARELHDVIGHSVSVMTVQASAVRRRLRPEQAIEREALETVEAVGREALREMRQMVAVLRDAGDWGSREPPPTLADLPGLVDKFRTAGLPVEVTVTGTSRPLAPGLDLTAYRLLQEGLTNAMRHAVAPSRAEVTITYADDRLDLAVVDDGGPLPAPTAAGNGLLGMRERVSVYGGDLLARPRAGGGFELRASLPLVPA